MRHVLQKFVLPTDHDPDVLPLYVDADEWARTDGQVRKLKEHTHVADVLSRTRLRIPARQRTSLGTYFNAFPASYWQEWTSVDEVRLTVRTKGEGTLVVYRSTDVGVRREVDSAGVADTTETSFDIPLDAYRDGGWIWFDVIAQSEMEIDGAEWTSDIEPPRDGRASIGVTTYNKPAYCVKTLRQIADAPDLRDLVDRIFLVDQGTDAVTDATGFDEVATALSDQLVVITQPNLGGSGGFARTMIESLSRPETAFVQLLDDDVLIEPESVRRSIMFARFASRPTIVGGHMFDLLNRPVLHAWAEVVESAPFMWRNLYQEQFPHDFSRANLRQTPLLHRRLDADYNGWWMCLLPVEAIREVGAALPAFIKWDDAEFCLRAATAGIRTVSLPGAALWHVSWVGKDDSIDWQAYFHARNRIVTALLHSPHPRGGRLTRHSRRADLKHLMMMQYYPVTLRHQAIRDILTGPDHMWRTLSEAMPEARAAATSFPETERHLSSSPAVSRPARQLHLPVDEIGVERSGPSGLARVGATAAGVLRRWFEPSAPADAPATDFAKSDATWWRLPGIPHARVGTADGAATNVYRHDRRAFRTLLRESMTLHRRLEAEWAPLAAAYRAALPDLTSPTAWRVHLGLRPSESD